jgi:hypothetical protein
VFSVRLNGREVISNLELARSPGILKPLSQTVEVAVADGVEVSFAATQGAAVLNAIELVQIK